MNTPVSRRSLLKQGLGLGGALFLTSCGVKLTAPAPNVPGTLGSLAVPDIASCAVWKAQPERGAITVLNSRPTRILVHHTDTPNTTDFSQAQAFALARSIQQSHFGNGWIDTGQHFTVSRGGVLMEGRHRSLAAAQSGAQFVSGAHCPGQNEVGVGIENEGNYMGVAPPAAQYAALVRLCTYLSERYGIVPSEIYGHRDFYNTDCPGDVLYAMLPKLRADVAAARGQTLRLWPTVRAGQSGERVRSVQYLLRARGQTLTPDGSYGSGTQGAVSSFQTGAGLTPDGLVGSLTWERLVLTVRSGDAGEAVRAVQGQLAARGAGVGVDGVFGPGTDSAVRAFQRAQNLSADGVVGPNTWLALVQ